VELGWYVLCLAVGRILRSGKYSKTRIVRHDGEIQVRKHRLFYAPFLISIGGPLLKILDTGVRVLSQQDWEVHEREIYRRLGRAAIRSDVDGTLVLPWLGEETLAAMLADSTLEDSVRRTAIELAVVALAELHRLELTHGDAMAENVIVDVDAGVAHWLDFETVHESSRPMAWRRADDVRALLATSLNRTAPEKLGETVQLIVDAYGDEEVTRLVAASFASVFRRSLAFHLGQAGLSFRRYRKIARLLSARVGDS
jgi:hypothetical protein